MPLDRHARRHAAAAAALTTLLAGAAGCSSVKPPTFELVRAELGERGDQGAVVRFVILAENPNEQTLPVRLAHYSVTAEGRPIFRGSRSAEIELAGFGSSEFVLPAAAPLEGLPESLALGEPTPVALSGRLEYVTPGALAEVLFDTGLRRTSARMRLEGVAE